MFPSILPAESEPNSGVRSRWLSAARCFAFICTIALGVGFVAEAKAVFNGPVSAVFTFGPWGLLSLVLLGSLFLRGKNPLAFALGLGTAAPFIALFGVPLVSSRGPRDVLPCRIGPRFSFSPCLSSG